MSENPYLDTFIGRVMSSPAHEGESPTCVEVLTFRAVSYQQAQEIMKRETTPAHNEYTEVRRWRHPRLIASPGDQRRAREREARLAKANRSSKGK